jgi:hypothetical protein
MRPDAVSLQFRSSRIRGETRQLTQAIAGEAKSRASNTAETLETLTMEVETVDEPEETLKAVYKVPGQLVWQKAAMGLTHRSTPSNEKGKQG